MSSNKIRDALLEASIALSWATHNHLTSGDAEKYLKIVDDALAAPPRNCDVGTAEEQSERFTKFCCSQDCKRTCPFSDDYYSYQCEFAWAQMPYEEGCVE